MQKCKLKLKEEYPNRKLKYASLLPCPASPFFDATVAAKQSFKFTSCYNGRGHISEPCTALEQHQRAQNKACTVHAELTQAYIILDCNLSQS